MSLHELTSLVAYKIFEQRGYAHGRHREDWFAAEDIIGLCQALVGALDQAEEARPAPVTTTATPAPARPRGATGRLASKADEERALELLAGAVASVGRAATAARLGYRSSSPVGRLLKGERALRQDVVERILAALDPAAADGAPPGALAA